MKIATLILILCASSASASSIQIPGAVLPIPGPLQPNPRLLWDAPEDDRRNIPPLSGGVTDYRVRVIDLFTPAGEIRLQELEILATRLLQLGDSGDFTEDPSFMDVSVITSIDPPDLHNAGDPPLSGRLIGTMTLPVSSYWKFTALSEFGGQQLSDTGFYFPIPEPSTSLLAAFGLLCLAIKRR